MQIVSLGKNLHDLSSLVSGKNNNNKKKKMLSAEIFTPYAKQEKRLIGAQWPWLLNFWLSP